MQIKYPITFLSGISLVLQLSTPLVSATPIKAITNSGAEITNGCLKENDSGDESTTLSECFKASFSDIFVDSLTKAAKGDNATNVPEFQDTVTSMIGVTSVCLKNSSPENAEADCLNEFYKLLVEVSNN
ncbi:hypothetical protein INT45_007899 [Circinella minor]|uniref:Uncharacterized protein n=1 Tax=Circinella minor TaxID=1195481 RepID=A0A8H7S6S4_9FUNG|nr:hypothetical protein INT45_007899 [Circinella minor]